MKTLEQQNRILSPAKSSFKEKIGLLTTLFGCWHKNLSRPFTYDHESYRVCLKCGARKNFNTETLTTSGSFYFPPKSGRTGF